MLNKNLELILSKNNIYKKLLHLLKPGQQVIVFLLFKGAKKQLRIVSYKGTVTHCSKNNLNSIVVVQQLIFKYKVIFRLNINCLNLYNFQLVSVL